MKNKLTVFLSVITAAALICSLAVLPSCGGPDNGGATEPSSSEAGAEESSADDSADEPAAEGKVSVYPFPEGMESGEAHGYAATVNGEDPGIYYTAVNHSHRWNSDPETDSAAVIMFDCEGEVQVRLTVPESNPQNVVVRPLSKGVSPEVENGEIVFSLKETGQYSVEYNNDPETAVMIFANPLDDYVPGPDDLVYEAGVHHPDMDKISVHDGQTLYLAPGAVVKAKVFLHNNATIRGRGIIDGSDFEVWTQNGNKAYLPINVEGRQNVSIEGVTIFDPNAWCVQLNNSSGITIDDLKIVAARCNSDGISIQSSSNITVTNTFVRSWDDSLVIKVYGGEGQSHDISFDNCVIWTDLAQSMEIGYETNKGENPDPQIYNVTFNNIDVIHNLSGPVMSIHNADDCAVHDITYKNINVEDTVEVNNQFLFDFGNPISNSWTTVRDRRGSVKNISAENITVTGSVALPSKIDAGEGVISGVSFKNVNICDMPANTRESMNCTVTGADNVTFS